MAALYIILIIVISYFAFSVLKRCQKDKKFPGPPGKPVLGVLCDLDLEKLHVTFNKWSKQYGDLFQFTCLGKKFLVVSSSELVRDLFLKEPTATTTAGRLATFAGRYFFRPNSDVVFATSPDQNWTKRRKMVYQILNAYGEGLMDRERQITQNLITMKNEIQSFIGQTVDPNDVVEEFILNTIEDLLIGRSFGRHGQLQSLMKRFDHDFNEITNMGHDIVYSALPFLRFLPLPHSTNVQNVLKMKDQLMDMLDSMSKEETGDKGVYQFLKNKTLERDPSGHQWFTDLHLWSMIVDLIVAGHLTTRGTLLSMIHILTKRPDLQKSLQTEIDNVIGFARKPNLTDRRHCALVESVTMETLRFISHSPILLHATTEMTNIAGVPVDQNTSIAVNAWAIHHSDKEWNEPFSFKPERFLQPDGSLMSSTDPVRKRLLAFGIGKRGCIGEVFAKSRIFLFLATLMQSFTILEPEDCELPDFLPKDMEPGLLLQPKPYKVRFVQREK
ncbi:steroid 17-alpha-hydroxylase/17,20 lyase-like isoform X3 [Ostrea edulis]|uniref:steroid 17-alpha-hydroxylase/17,20 lyase-like isoform X3 n=1 Tax=Ostrea edulis TaxID=37623 RepID=UPI0024AFDB86|nr:steroid 17-alpha-hydroxylase/17,20 lyase-like isoform X3 [Ostrea edulis]